MNVSHICVLRVRFREPEVVHLLSEDESADKEQDDGATTSDERVVL